MEDSGITSVGKAKRMKIEMGAFYGIGMDLKINYEKARFTFKPFRKLKLQKFIGALQ